MTSPNRIPDVSMRLSVGVLLASLALLRPLHAAPTLCMQPISNGAYSYSFNYMVPFPGSDSRVALTDTDGKIYSAFLPPPGTTQGLLNLTLLIDLGPRLSSWPGVGIRGLAFHPDFSYSRRMFVSYVCGTDNWGLCNSVSPDGQGPTPYCACDLHPKLCSTQQGGTEGCQNVLVVDEFFVPADSPVRGKPVTRVAAVGQAYSDNIGGEILFQPGNSLLYLATGDGGAGLLQASLSQNQSSPLGKVLRMDVDAVVPSSVVKERGFLGQYGPPQGNFGQTGVASALYAIGLKNPHGCAAYPATPAAVLCTDMGRATSNEVVQVAQQANFGWPLCPPSWTSLLWGSQCNAPVLKIPSNGIQSEPFGGAKVLQGGYLGGNGDMCASKWLLWGYNNGTLNAVPEDSSKALSFSGAAQAVAPKCYSNSTTPCTAPVKILSWMRNPVFLQEGVSDQPTLPYLIADTGIYQVVNPAMCGAPCAPPPGPLPQSPPYNTPPGGTPSTGTPSPAGTPPSGTPSSGTPASGTPASGTPSSAPADASATPVTSGGEEDANSFLSASGIQGTFDSTYWIKLSVIFGVLTVIVCSICCFFIIMGWKEGRKKDQRFLELKQAETDLDERTRDPDDDTMVYQPAGDPDDDDGTVVTDEDGTEYNEEMSEEDSMSQYSSRHGPESASGRSASTRSRRRDDDGGSDAGTDYTGYTGYTGYSGRTGQTGYSSRTGQTGPSESAVSRSRRDGMSDAQSYTTGDDWTETASGYGYAYGP